MYVMNLQLILVISLTTTVSLGVLRLVNNTSNVCCPFNTLILEVYSDVCDEPAPNIINLTNQDSGIGSAVVSE